MRTRYGRLAVVVVCALAACLDAGGHRSIVGPDQDAAGSEPPVARALSGPTEGLLSHWTFDEGSGTTAADAVGTNHGTLVGNPAWATGVDGAALDLDGIDDALVNASPTGLAFPAGSDFTFSAWLKPRTGQADGSKVVEKKLLGREVIDIIYRADLKPTFRLRDGDGNFAFAASAVAMSAGSWHSLIGVKSGDDILLYLDGALAASTTYAFESHFEGGELRIGYSIDGGASRVDGVVDDVRIYGRALTFVEIQDLSASEPDVTAPSVPANPAASAISPSRIDVSWDASSDDRAVAGYRVYRDGVGVGTTTATTYPDGGLAPESTHSYTVAAFDLAGNASAQSAAVSATTPAATTTGPTEGLISHWPLDEGTGAAAADVVGGNDGTLVGEPAWTTGVYGGALDLDGTGQHVVSASPTGLSFPTGSDFTFSAWIRPRIGQSPSKVVEKKRLGGELIDLSYWEDLKPTFRLRDHDGNLAFAASGVAMAAGSWHSLVGVKSGNDILLYVDGALVGSTTFAFTSHWEGGDLRIGYSVDGFPHAVDGTVDDVRIYGRALTLAEVQSLAVTEPDESAPSAPTGLAVAGVASRRVDLSWAAATDDVAVVSYRVYRDGVAVGTTSGTTISDTGVAPETTYSYTVSARDAAGNESARSAAVSATTTAETTSGPTEGLISHWTLDEGSGTTAADAAGTNHGTLVGGPTWTTGVSGGALDFDGVDDHVHNASPTGLAFPAGSDFSFAAWLNPRTGQAAGPSKVVEKKSLGAELIDLAYGADLKPVFRVRDRDGNFAFAASSVAMVAGGWHSLVGVKNGNTISLYMDGVEVGSTTFAFGSHWEGGDVRIGHSVDGGPHGADGIIDDVRIYGRPLTLAEVQSLAATEPDVTAPSVPANLAVAAVASRRVDLSWMASSDDIGVASYQVYRDGVAVGTTSGLTSSDTGVAPGTTYSYTVSARDAAGNASAQSAPVSAATPQETTSGPTAGLISRWAFDEGAGPTAADAVGTNHGTLVGGPTWTNGVSNGALDFDGVDDHVINANPAGLAFHSGSDVTFTLWLNPRTGRSPSKVVEKKRLGGELIDLVYGADLKPEFRVRDRDGNFAFVASTVAMVAGSWHSLVGVKNGSSLSLYLDGVQVASTAFTFGSNWEEGELRIGSSIDGDQYGTDGSIDDVRIYGRALTLAEIIDLVDVTAPSVPGNLVATAISQSRIDVTWDAATDDIAVAGYRLYRDGVQIATPTGTTYQDVGLASGVTYSYTVAAFDEAGNVSAQSAPAAARTKDLLAHWMFDEGSGTTAADAIGTNHGTLMGDPTWTTGISGGALDLDGTGDYVIAASPTGLAFPAGSNFTFAAWINPRAGQSDGSKVVEKKRAGGELIDLVYFPDLKAHFRLRDGDGNTGAVVSSVAMAAGSWHSLVGVKNGNDVSLYLDGVLVGGSTFTFTSHFNGGDVRIGSSVDAGARLVDGIVDDVRIYARPLTTVEIQSLAATEPDVTAPSVPANLVANAASQSRIDLSWDASTDDRAVAGYRVFRDGVEVATTTTTTYQDNGLAAATTYSYAVAAFDLAGNASAPAAPAAATTSPPDATAPSVPTDLAVTAAASRRVDLSWAPSSDDVGVASYQVYRDGVLVGTTSGLTFSDTGVVPQTTYGYTVSAADAAGNTSAQSAAVSATTPEETAPTDGLISHWTFDDGIGTTAADAVGTNDGTLVGGPAWMTTGVFGGSLDFDGVDDHVIKASPTGLAFPAGGDFTFAAWLNPRTGQADASKVVEKKQTGGETIELQYAPDLVPSFRLRDRDGNGALVTSSVAMVAGGWHSLVGVKSGNNVSLYLNGALVGSTSVGFTGHFNGGDLRIGSSLDGGQRKVDGIIDDVRIYGRALTTNEIQSLYALDSDVTAPSAPTGVTVTAVTGQRVDLSWTAAIDDLGVVGYQVYRDGVLVGTTNQLSFSDAGVAPGSTYSYTVSATDAAGNASAPSAAVSATTPEETTPTAGLISHWMFDEGGGTTAADAVGTNDGALVGGPAWMTTGVFGGSLDFDGVDDHVIKTSPTGLSFPAGSDFSFAAWLNPRTGQVDASKVVEKKQAGGETIELQYTPDLTPGFRLRDRDGNGALVTSSVAMVAGGWYSLVGVKSGNDVSLYLDGVLVGSTAVTFTSHFNGGDLRIGSSLDGGQRKVDGIIDDVRIYGRALTTTEIQKLYALDSDATAPGAPTGVTVTTATSQRVDLSWTAATDDLGVVSYQIYRDGAAVGTTHELSFSDAGVAPGATYSYTVGATDAAGNTSAQSAAVSATTPQEATAGLISHWTFDEGTGTTATDAIGANHGTLVGGPAWMTTGVFGGSLNFDGVDDHVVKASPTGLSFPTGSDFTFAVWINPRTGQADASKLIEKKQTGGETIDLQYTPDLVPSFRLRDRDGIDALVVSSGAMVAGSWHSVIGIKSGNNVSLYVNGALVGSTSAAFTGHFNGGDLLIGSSVDGGQRKVDGIIDDVRIFGRALTTSEIQSLSTTAPDGTAPSMPTDLTATVYSQTRIDLSWNPSGDDQGVTGYRVYRDGVEIATTTAISYQVSGLTAATTYSLTVAAFDHAGNVSAQSAPAVATTLAPVPVVFPGATWETRAPADLGLEAANLDQIAAEIGGSGLIVKSGFVAKSWGSVDAHGDWGSAVNPVLSTLLFFALEESRLSGVDELVRPRVQSLVGTDLIAKDQTMTFAHLANMVSGYALPEAPGGAWGYNEYGATLYAKLIIDQVYNQDPHVVATDVARMGKLQFEDGSLFHAVNGHGLNATIRDFARIGWFWLNRGLWGGEQLLPEQYFTDYVKPQVASTLPRTAGGTPNDYLGTGPSGGIADQTPYGPGKFGFGFWFNPNLATWPDAPEDTFEANGHWNEWLMFVIPSLKAVLVAKGNWGSWEPGTDSNVNHILGLLVNAVRE